MFDLLAQSPGKASELTWPQVVNGAICPVCILLALVAMFWCGGKAGTVKVVKVYGSKDKEGGCKKQARRVLVRKFTIQMLSVDSILLAKRDVFVVVDADAE